MARREPGQQRDGKREGGFALIVVLGALPVLAMLGSVVQLSGRSEVLLAGNLREAATQTAAADGAIREALFHLVAGDWAADGAVHVVRIGMHVVPVRIEDESGRINPGLAPPALLRALLLTLGVEPGRAQSLAACIFDFRDAGETPSPHGAKAAAYRAAGKLYGPSGLPFQWLDELRLVLGMTDDLYELLLPHLSVHVGEAIDLAHADPVVRAAYRMAGPNGGYPTPRAAGGAFVATISTVPLGGSGSGREASVRVYDASSPDQAYEVLDWTTQVVATRSGRSSRIAP